MNKKMILFTLVICIIIGVIYLFVFQSGGRWIYVHEFESTPPTYYKFYNLTATEMERFPFILESIQKNAAVHISEARYNELMNFLDVHRFVEWADRYYEIQIRMS